MQRNAPRMHQIQRNSIEFTKSFAFPIWLTNHIHPLTHLPAYIPIIELDPLPTPYPPEGHIVFERPYSTLLPQPKKRDLTYNYLYKYGQLDESMLQYTLDVDKEAIFVDKTT